VNYWLFKSEPESFSIDDLERAPKQTTFWNGVRNYQARNFLRDSIKVGDRVLFYHSNADPTAIVGTATVVKAGYPDHTAWDKKSNYFDEAASPENPIWQMVDIRFEQKFARQIPLDELRAAKELTGMELLRRGSRLSVQPVSEKHFQAVLKMASSATAKKKK
jgi:predicted RNA-binding protein with PUA-like domain